MSRREEAEADGRVLGGNGRVLQQGPGARQDSESMEAVRAVRQTGQACVCDEGSVSGDGRVPRVSCAVWGCNDVRDLRVQDLRAPGHGCVVCVAVDGTPVRLWPGPRVR